MEITAAMVKKLRDATGAGMMECKAALTEANGDIEAATTLLRKRGPRAGRQEGRPLDLRGADRPLHPHGRQDRRARRGELRVRLRRADRRLPGAGEGDRDAHRGRQPDVRPPRGRPGRRRSSARSEIYRDQVQGQAGRRSSTRSSRASWTASTSSSACSTRPRSAIPTSTIAQLVAGRASQTRREHHRSRAVRRG